MGQERRIVIPSLFGGISHQPAHLRFPNQVQDSVNANFSVFDGATKRPGSAYLKNIISPAPTALSDNRLHAIKRDSSEKYLVMYGPGSIRVFELPTCLEATVTISNDAQTYLNKGTLKFSVSQTGVTWNEPATSTLVKSGAFTGYTFAEGDMVLVTGGTGVTTGWYAIAAKVDNNTIKLTGDITAGSGAPADVVINGIQTPPVSGDIRMSTVADYTIIANQKQATAAKASSIYAISETFSRLADMFATNPADDSYHALSDGDSDKFPVYYKFNSGDGEFARYRMGNTFGDWAAPHKNYNDDGNNPMGFSVFFERFPLSLTGVAWDEAGSPNFKLTKSGAFTNAVAGQYINITGGTNVAAGAYKIAVVGDDSNIALETSITTLAGDAADITTNGLGYDYEVVADFPTTAKTDMQAVASVFQAALRNAGSNDGMINWTDLGGNSGYMTIVSDYRGSNAKVHAPRAPAVTDPGDVTNISDSTTEPFSVAGTGEQTNGSGTPETDTFPISERWTLVPKSGQASATLDNTTMPIKMTRDTFTGDGSTPATFSVSLIDWNERLSGDEENNPAPSIVKNGDSITDVGLHRNRLMIGGQENIAFSQSGDLFNFYIQDAENIVDSDPIDVSLSSDAVTIIDYLVPFRDTVIVFTKAARQFEINTPDVFSPSTISITPSTKYEAVSVRPVAMGTLIYFLGSRKDTSILYEYFYDDAKVSNVATDVSAHVFGLLPTDFRTLRTSTNNLNVFILTDDCDKIYVYQTYWQGNRKEQAAWTKWQFDDKYRINDMEIIENDLYLLVEDENTNNFLIEQLPISRQVT